MSYQLPLFPFDEPLNPDPIQLLRDGAALVLRVSGGQDSDAIFQTEQDRSCSVIVGQPMEIADRSAHCP